MKKIGLLAGFFIILMTSLSFVFALNITINSPVGNYNYVEILFNVTFDDENGTCFYALDNETNMSMDYFGNLTWIAYVNVSQGGHNVTYHCNDTEGNWSINKSSFYVDSIAPYLVSWMFKYNDGFVSYDTIAYISPANQDGVRDGIKINLTASEIVEWIVNITNLSDIYSFSKFNNSNNFIKPNAGCSYWEGTSKICSGSNLSEGLYWFNITMNDTLGNIVYNNSLFVVIDNTRPAINDNSVSSGYYNTARMLNLSFSDAYNVNASLYVNNTIVNSSAGSNETILTYLLTSDGNYSYYAVVYDMAMNNNTISAGNIIIDNINPAIIFSSGTETSGTLTNRNTIFVNVSAFDVNLANISVYLYNSTDLVNFTVVESGIMISFDDLADGIYYFNATALDLAGNFNSTETRNFTIDTTNPSAVLLTPADGTNTSLTSLNLTANFTDDKMLKNATLYVYNSTGMYYSSSIIVSGTQAVIGIIVTLADEVYTWFYSLFDFAGNNDLSENSSFIVDSISPIISFEADTELNNSFLNRNNVIINVSAVDLHLSNITIFLYNSSGFVDSAETSSSNLFQNFTDLLDGIYYFNATAYDFVNNKASTETRKVTIDTIFPVVNFAANSEANNANLSRKNIFVNVSVLEINFKNITFRLNSNSISYNTPTFSYNFTNLADGDYAFNVSVCDLAGNCNISETRSVIIDTTAPSLTINTPSGIYNYSNVLVNITASDVHTVTTWFFNGTGNETYDVPITRNFAEGNNVIYAYATDNFGNQNSATRSFTIDLTAPSTSALSSYSFGTWSNSSVSVNLSCSDALTGCAETLYCIDTSNTCIPSNVYSSALTLSNEGTNYLRYRSRDNAGNYEEIKNKIVKIDTSKPSLTITSPINTVYSSSSIDVNYAVSDAVSGIFSCSYSIDGVNVSLSSCNNFTLNLVSGMHILSLSVLDNAGNYNRTFVYFAVDLPTDNVTSINSNLTLTSYIQEIVITSLDVSLINITSSIPGESETYINLGLFVSYNGTTSSITLPNSLIIERNTENGTYVMYIPAGTTITSEGTWDGRIALLNKKNESLYSLNNGRILKVLEVGSNNELGFSHPVRLAFLGYGGMGGAWGRNMEMNKINTLCNSVSNPSNLNSINRECHITSGKDLLIWTNHFTIFGVYETLSYLVPNSYIIKNRDSSGGSGKGELNDFALRETDNACSETWQCTEWSSCNNGYKTRECRIKQNGCDTIPSSPETVQVCGITLDKNEIDGITGKAVSVSKNSFVNNALWITILLIIFTGIVIAGVLSALKLGE